MDIIQSKIRACLLGGAIGDALGYAVEFDRMGQILGEYGPEGIQNYRLSIDKKARISDDTQMTIFTAYGLLRGQAIAWSSGKYQGQPAEYIYGAYLDWLRTQTSQGPVPSVNFLLREPALWARRAPGGTCLSALRSGQMGSVEVPINDSKGCGGVMRVAPVALLYGQSGPEALAMEGAKAAAITHGHPLGYIPAAYLCYLIAGSVYAPDLCLKDLTQQANTAMDRLFGASAAPHSLLMEEAIRRSENSLSDRINIRALGEGWVGEEAMAIGLYCALRHSADFSAAIRASVNHDGDSDSTGAITGNLLGARLGMAAIDAHWLKNLELHDLLVELADDLYFAGQSLGQTSGTMDRRFQKYL